MRLLVAPVIAAVALVASPVIAQSSGASAMRAGEPSIAASALQDDMAAEGTGVNWAIIGAATAAVILGVVLLVDDEEEDEPTSP